jgi:hypothetical protein
MLSIQFKKSCGKYVTQIYKNGQQFKSVERLNPGLVCGKYHASKGIVTNFYTNTNNFIGDETPISYTNSDSGSQFLLKDSKGQVSCLTTTLDPLINIFTPIDVFGFDLNTVKNTFPDFSIDCLTGINQLLYRCGGSIFKASFDAFNGKINSTEILKTSYRGKVVAMRGDLIEFEGLSVPHYSLKEQKFIDFGTQIVGLNSSGTKVVMRHQQRQKFLLEFVRSVRSGDEKYFKNLYGSQDKFYFNRNNSFNVFEDNFDTGGYISALAIDDTTSLVAAVLSKANGHEVVQYNRKGEGKILGCFEEQPTIKYL